MLAVITHDLPGGSHNWHSTEAYAEHPDCAECKSIHDYETNPRPEPPKPTIYTDADLRDGADALLVALRRDCTAYHAQWPQYAGYADNQTLGIITKRVTHARKGFTYAERGDAVLFKPEPDNDPDFAGMLSVWVPRTHTTVVMRKSDVRAV